MACTNRRQERQGKVESIFTEIDDTAFVYVFFMLGCTFTLLFYSWLFWGNYFFRIVLNLLELKVAFTGIFLSMAVVAVLYSAYSELDGHFKEIRDELIYNFGLILIVFFCSLFFGFLLVDWFAKEQYKDLNPIAGIKWSLWEYHSQRLLNHICLDALFDVVLIRMLRLSSFGKVPAIGRIAIAKKILDEKEVELILLRQRNIRDKLIQEYKKKAKIEYQELSFFEKLRFY